jgi:chorismate mutase/prephenate dehydratase
LESESDIRKLRAEIDEIDMALVRLIARRKEAALEIAKLKQTSGPQEDEKRLKEVLRKVQKKSEETGLDGDEMKEIWKKLIGYMIKEQMAKYPY